MRALSDFAGNQPPGNEADVIWGGVTILLGVAVTLGYGVIAFKWYFQSKMSRRAEANAALARLRIIFVCCAAGGVAFVVTDPSWGAWRVYDGLLLLLGCHTWTFARRVRGLSLVDERLAQLDELERTARRYREIAELLPHVVWTATADGRVDFSNQLWDDYTGGAGSWLDAVHPDERAEVAAWWDEVVKACRPDGREVQLEGQDGYRTFALKATPIVNGQAVKWLGACADVEDQKRLAAEQETQAKRKSFFLNALSHDLRAPLNVVVLNAQLLKMQTHNAEEAEIADTVVENAIAAADMVSRLLDFAKAGEERAAAEVVSVQSVLHQVRRRFLPHAERKGLYLRVTAAEDDVRVLTDRHNMERVISNLVDNAVKYTRHGGVDLSMSAAADGVRVRVDDTGVGIPKESAPRLFDEFFQVNNQERDRTKGFGLGLAICKSLARKLGGDVRLVKTSSAGSCFEFALTPHRRDAGRPSAVQPADASQPPGRTLLRCA